MFSRAKKEYDEHRVKVTDWEAVVPTLNKKNVVLIPNCLDGDCCDAVKDETAAKGKSDQAAEDAKAPSMGAKGMCSRPLICRCLEYADTTKLFAFRSIRNRLERFRRSACVRLAARMRRSGYSLVAATRAWTSCVSPGSMGDTARWYTRILHR
jgi:hypothetical protein